MSTALVPMADLDRYAQAFASSGMFGTKTKEQALSLLLLAQAEGVHPAIAMRDFDIIQGRPAKKAQAMHRAFIEAGGKIEWHERSDTKADATFSHPQGGTVRVSWDLERAKKAGLGAKEMYGKYTRQMLSARVISEGCRTVYPAATSGLYVPEEVRAFEKKERDMGKADVVDPDITEEIPLNAAPQASEAPPSSYASSATPAGAAPTVTREAALKDLCSKKNVNYAELLKRAGVTHADEMTEEDFKEAKAMLERRKAA